LGSSNLSKSINYWNGILGLTIYERTEKSASFAFNEKATRIELEAAGKLIKFFKTQIATID